MHPFKHISDQSINSSRDSNSSIAVDDTITRFLRISAYYFGIPAEALLRQSKTVIKHRTNNKE